MTRKRIDLFIVGAGLSGATVARITAEAGVNVVVVDSRDHVAGNCHTPKDERVGVYVHRYGAHIFHTSNRAVTEFVRRFAVFNGYQHEVASVAHGRLYPMPINNETLRIIRDDTLMPDGMNETATRERLTSIAIDLLCAGYTAKQWQKPIDQVPASVLNRVKPRDNNDRGYFADTFQGIPEDGYTAMVERMLDHPNITVDLNETVTADAVAALVEAGIKVYWTGPASMLVGAEQKPEYWRSVRFDDRYIPMGYAQDYAVVNYADIAVPFTRQIEHKRFMACPGTRADGASMSETLLTTEYSCDADDERGIGPAYPVITPESQAEQKAHLARAQELYNGNVHAGGRLGKFAYMDMDQAILSAMHDAARIMDSLLREGRC